MRKREGEMGKRKMRPKQKEKENRKRWRGTETERKRKGRGKEKQLKTGEVLGCIGFITTDPYPFYGAAKRELNGILKVILDHTQPFRSEMYASNFES